MTMNKEFEGLGFYPGDILLPQGVDLTHWSVVACDQYTSEPEYWQRVEERVGEAPSTLRLILPESKLNDGHVEEHIAQINRTMEDYLEKNVFTALPQSLIYVERVQHNGALRRGLVGVVDLEDYDYTPGSDSLIRATEGTVLSRIPPRVKVREHAALELPHVMLLIDDREKQVIEPLTDQRGEMTQVYDFDLMEQGGHLTGYRLTEGQMSAVAAGLHRLNDPIAFAEKYQVTDRPVLLFAVGDGNHSLATAKAAYQLRKEQEPETAELARYALVEVVNLHEAALEFEPIHRVVFDVDPAQAIESLLNAYPGAYLGKGEGQQIDFVWEKGEGTVTVPNPTAQLAVGTLQGWLDGYLEAHGGRVDYIHGADVTCTLGRQPGNLGFLLPHMGKEQLFRTVICDGVLPRKTFSMGEAHDKRFYLEARAIR